MSNAQWTVTGFILILIGLELLRMPTLKTWFKTLFSTVNTALGNSSKGA